MQGAHQVAQKWTRVTGARRGRSVADWPLASTSPGASKRSSLRGQKRTARAQTTRSPTINLACRPRGVAGVRVDTVSGTAPVDGVGEDWGAGECMGRLRCLKKGSIFDPKGPTSYTIHGPRRLYNQEESRFARPRRVFLVGLVLPGQPGPVVEEHLDELAQLAESAGATVVDRTVQARRAPDAATFIGRGKAEAVAAAARERGADLLVFHDDLSPSQVKNLEEVTGLPVFDRSGLILEIFGQRARTR